MRAAAIDGSDIGTVDEAEAQVGGPMPHREGRRLDQARQRFERVAQLFDFALERADFRLTVGRVEYPQNDAAIGRQFRPGGGTAYQQQPRGAHAAHRQREALARTLRRRDLTRQCGCVLRLQPAVGSRQFGGEVRHTRLAQPFGEAIGGFHPSIGVNDDRRGGGGRQQCGKPVELALRLHALALPAGKRPDSRRQP